MYIWVSIMKYIDHKCMPCMYQAFITNVQRMYSYICTNIYAYPNKETYISEYRKSRRASTRDQECKTQTHRRMNIYACTHSRTRTQNTHTYTRNKKANPPPPPFSLNHLTRLEPVALWRQGTCTIRHSLSGVWPQKECRRKRLFSKL